MQDAMNISTRKVKPEGMKVITECRMCHKKNLHSFLSLGPIPLSNSFLSKDQLSKPEPYYPLDVHFCSDCGLVQLGQVIDPELMFKDYAYLTGTSSPMKTHFSALAKHATKKFNIPKGSLIVDIGSNDGTLLDCFKILGMKVLGIEPATNVAKLAMSRGIETLDSWFSKELAQNICLERGKPRVILATNVFAHVHDIDGFIRGIIHLMDSDSVFIIEVPYLIDMLNKVEFDTIYHEHLSYISLRPLVTFFKEFGMDIIDVERIDVHGGSLRVYVQKDSTASSPTVKQLLELEIKTKLDSIDTYRKFATSVGRIKVELTSLLNDLKGRGARISGYGAPAKGNILLNFCQIGTEILDYVSDTTPFKQGRYTPGMHIPIYPENHFHKSPPDYALLLAWNYTQDILIKEDKYQKAGGKFIVPIPKPQIV